MKKILLVVDVQNDFITGSLANEQAQAVVPKIVDKINNFNGDAIVFTMDTHDLTYLNTKEGQKLPVEHCIHGSDGWEIQPDVLSAIQNKMNAGIKVFPIEKPTFGAIGLPGTINAIIQNTEESEIEVCGFCTDICVVSNVLLLKAFFYKTAEITVNSELCAGVTPEKHEAALETMRSCQINVI